MQNDIYKIDYDYELPEELIAKFPPANRTDSQLLISANGNFHIHKFAKLIDLIDSDDILVLNETKVNPSRLRLTKNTGGKVEILVLEIKNKFTAVCLSKGLNKKIKEQQLFSSQFPLKITVLKDLGDTVEIKFAQDIQHLCNSIGEMPIPPYLNRDSDVIDNDRYQTVFANEKFQDSAAAPTASLHLDETLLSKISEKIKVCKLNLSVGLGTFKPLGDTPINDSSKLHSEKFYIPKETASCINEGIAAGKRIIALGTTTLRALEAAWNDDRKVLKHGHMSTDLFIFEGFKFNVVNSLITNFHLPQSSLLMLVSAFAGKKLIFDAYQYAIENKMRFFSYGDAMIIER